MLEPIDELKKLSTSSAAPKLPPAEVRRRGERMRRRRTAFQAMGAAAAVLVVVSGGAFVTGSLTGAQREPAPAGPSRPVSPSHDAVPRGGWTTEIPAGFSLDDGMPEPGLGQADAKARVLRESLWGPWTFDPCRERARGEVSRTDFLDVLQVAPAETYRRQLAVYANDDTAAAVMAHFAAELERCPNHQNYDGPGGEFSEETWARYGDGVENGDESFAWVAHVEQSGVRMTLATHYAAVRVGNAVLVATYDGEFGAGRRQDVEEVDRRMSGYASAVAERMCVFATDPCVQQADGVDAPREAAPEALPSVLDAETLRAVTGVDGWETTAESGWSSVLCAEESTEALAGDRTDTRRFAVMRSGEAAATAVVQVLDFRPATRAAGGYERAAGWLASCRRPVDRVHRIASAGDAYGDLHAASSSYGPMTWRTVMSSAPEICVECDAAWNNHQGVVLTDKRLVLLQVSYRGDLQTSADDSESPMPRLLRAAAKLAALNARVVG